MNRVNEQIYTILNNQGDISTYIMNFKLKLNVIQLVLGLKSEFMTGISHQLALQWNQYFDRYVLALQQEHLIQPIYLILLISINRSCC